MNDELKDVVIRPIKHRRNRKRPRLVSLNYNVRTLLSLLIAVLAIMLLGLGCALDKLSLEGFRIQQPAVTNVHLLP